MNALLVCAFLSAAIYCLLFNWTFIFLYSVALGGYFALSYIFVSRPVGGVRSKQLISTWSDPTAPVIFGAIYTKLSHTQELLKQVSAKAGFEVTLLHLAIKAVAEDFKAMPDVCGRLAFGCYVPNSSVDLGILINQDDPEPRLVFMEKVETKTLVEVAREYNQLIDTLQPIVKNTLPACLKGIFAEVASYLEVAMGVSIADFGLKSHRICAIIGDYRHSSVNTLYSPFYPRFRSPIVVNLLRPEVVPLNIEGEIKPELLMKSAITFDHRFGDGARAACAQRRYQEIMENPQKHLDPFAGL